MRKSLLRLSLLALLTSGMVLSRTRPTLERSGGPDPTTVTIAQAGSDPATYEAVLALVSEAVEAALGPGGFSNLIQPGDTVFIKLNANEWAVPMGLPPDGYLTDPRVARAVASLVMEVVPASQIKVGEGISHFGSTQLLDFMWGGYDLDLDGELDGAPEVQLVCLNEPHDAAHAYDPAYVTRIDLPTSHQSNRWWIPNVIANADVRISIPVLKAHNEAGLTCALKNSVGHLPADIYYGGLSYDRDFEVRGSIHQPYPKGPPAAIADINAAVPYHFAVVDALTAHRYGPWSTAPDRVYPRAIVAGVDAVAVDTVVASLVGWDPTSIDYLVYCHNDGTGIADPGYIAVRGVSVQQLRNDLSTRPDTIPFPLENGPTQGDTSGPWASISSPGNGDTVSGAVSVVLSCGDNRDVVRAELLVDGVPVDQTAYPGTSAILTWDTAAASPGDHTLDVVVYDHAFNEATSSRTVGVAGPPAGSVLSVY